MYVHVLVILIEKYTCKHTFVYFEYTEIYGSILRIYWFYLTRSDFVYDLFAHMTLDEDTSSGGRAFKMDRRGGGAKKKATVSTQFKVEPSQYIPV